MGQAWKTAERKMAKVLGQWACGNELALRRMPLQGRMMEEYLGDIIVNETADEPTRKRAADFLSHFMIDVKRRVGKSQSKTGWHLEQLLTSPKHQIVKWWNKLDVAAKKYKKSPILILTKGDGNWFIVISWELCKIMAESLNYNMPHSIHVRTSERLTVFKLDTFLKSISSKRLKEAHKKYGLLR